MPDLAHAPLATLLVFHLDAGGQIERGGAVHEKAIDVSPARQFHPETPDSIRAFVQGASYWLRIIFDQTNEYPDFLRLRSVEPERRMFGYGAVGWWHGEEIILGWRSTAIANDAHFFESDKAVTHDLVELG